MAEKSEQLTITNQCEEQLVGSLHRAKKKDLIIVCHGFGCNKDSELMIGLSEAFQKQGINAFRFSFSGIEPSGGKSECSCYTKQAGDLSSVIDHFSAEGYQIKSIVGHSMGGTATIIQAAKDRRIGSIILIAPRIIPSNSIIVKEIEKKEKTPFEIIDFLDLPEVYSVDIGKKRYDFSRRYLQELRDINVLTYLKQLQLPTFILHGTEDHIVSKKDVEEACQANRRIKYIPIKQAGHNFRKSDNKKKLIRQICKVIGMDRKMRIRAYCLSAPYIILFLLNCFFVFKILTVENTLQFLKKNIPLGMDQSLSITMALVILTLMSSLTLSYVGLINELSNFIRRNKEKKDISKASWRKTSLSFTALMFFVTIFFLLLRIICVEFFDEEQLIVLKFVQFIDWNILASFSLGTLMRIWLFWDSYGEDFTKHFPDLLKSGRL